MQRVLYVASGNAGKLRDFAAAAASVDILPLPGLSLIPAPQETGNTFEENARAKACYYSRFLKGEIVVADDSGLEVKALDHAPRVRSARYAQDAGFGDLSLPMDERNNLFLLSQLSGISHRAAQYRCVLAAARDGNVIRVSQGAVSGEILHVPRGSGGFGYDPLFYLPKLGRTMAEVELSEKNACSHRGNALRTLLQQLDEAGVWV